MPRMTTVEALEILDLKPGASKEAVEKAFRKMVKELHPDRVGFAGEEDMKRLNMARDYLKGYEPAAYAKQTSYSAPRSSPPPPPHSPPPHTRKERTEPRAEPKPKPRPAPEPKSAPEPDFVPKRDPEVHAASPAESPARLYAELVFHFAVVVWRVSVVMGQNALKLLIRALNYLKQSIPWSSLARPAASLVTILFFSVTILWLLQISFSAMGRFFSSLGSKTRSHVEVSASESPGVTGDDGFSYTSQYAQDPVPEWMSSDLSVTAYRNGDPVYHAVSKKEWKDAEKSMLGAWCYYGNDPSKGILYNRHAVNDPRGLAPEGWHIPDEKEWKNLLKQGIGSMFLNARGGFRKSGGSFSHYGKRSCYWVSGSRADNNSMSLDLKKYEFTREGDIIDNSGEGYSVRCVCD